MTRPDIAALLAALEQGVHELEPAEVPAVVARLGAVLAIAGARLFAPSSPSTNGDRSSLLTLDQAAAFLGKSRAWVRRKAATGLIPCARRVGRSWRFPAGDLERHVGRVRRLG